MFNRPWGVCLIYLQQPSSPSNCKQVEVVVISGLCASQLSLREIRPAFTLNVIGYWICVNKYGALSARFPLHSHIAMHWSCGEHSDGCAKVCEFKQLLLLWFLFCFQPPPISHLALTTACFVLTFVCLFALKADNPMIQLQKQEDRAGRISRGKYLNWPTDEKGEEELVWGTAFQIRAVG